MPKTYFKILSGGSALMASLFSLHCMEVALQKELPNGQTISVFRSIKKFDPRSKELHGLLEQWAKEWNQTGTNQPLTPNDLSSYIELTAEITTQSGQQAKLGWKHGYFDMIKYAGSPNDLQAFDVGLMSQKLLICYKEGPVLCVEEVPRQTSGDGRLLVWLVRDNNLQSHTIFTNAAFFTSPNGQSILKAQGDDGVELVWKYHNWRLELDLPRCKPENAKGLAENNHMIFETNRWVRKLPPTNSVPNQNANNPKH